MTFPELTQIIMVPKAGGGWKANRVSTTIDGLAISGTVAHGQVVTVSDADSRFGLRSAVKPIFVSFGKKGPGETLGRDTANYFNADSTVVESSAVVAGSLTTAVRSDRKVFGGAAFGNISIPDPTKPFIQYIERYYDYDITQAIYQGPIGFNLKTNRIWASLNGTDNNNMSVQYQGSEGGNSRIVVENTPSPTAWYQQTVPGFVFLSEEYLFKNSSAQGVKDGLMLHYRNNVLLNADPADQNYVTHDSTKPVLPNLVFFDQVSNGSGDGVANNYDYLGYFVLDDEYNAAYVGNASTRSACTKLVRQPQTAWSAGQISFQAVESQVTLAGSFLYFRNGRDTWVSNTGLPV